MNPRYLPVRSALKQTMAKIEQDAATLKAANKQIPGHMLGFYNGLAFSAWRLDGCPGPKPPFMEVQETVMDGAEQAEYQDCVQGVVDAARSVCWAEPSSREAEIKELGAKLQGLENCAKKIIEGAK